MRFTFLRLTSAAVVAVTPALVGTVGMVGMVATPAHASAPVSLHVSFRPASLAVPAGYTADTGAGFNGTSGSTNPASAATSKTT